MNELGALFVIFGYCAALFFGSLAAIKVEERRRLRIAELPVDRLAAGRASSGATVGRTSTAAAGTSFDSNVLALVAYLTGGIAGIFFLVGDKYKNDKFLRFHSFQSIFFSVVNIAFWIIFSVLGGILTAVTLGFGGLILALLAGLIGLAIMAYWILLMVKAYHNEPYAIPFIGGLAAKQAR